MPNAAQGFNNAPLRGPNSVIIPLVFLFGSALSYFRTVRTNRQPMTSMIALAAFVMFVAYGIICA